MAGGKQSFDFFDAQNVAAKQQREELAYSALDMALEWLGSCHYPRSLLTQCQCSDMMTIFYAGVCMCT